MRPVRLELDGFTAFRSPTVVDFTGTDLFALVGATGAGKSSIIDALTFALYGSVPRLDDRRAVAPVISQNLAEARIRLDFTVEGDTYTAVRVVRAAKSGGATTKEARLERGAEVLAGTAAAVTPAGTALRRPPAGAETGGRPSPATPPRRSRRPGPPPTPAAPRRRRQPPVTGPASSSSSGLR